MISRAELERLAQALIHAVRKVENAHTPTDDEWTRLAKARGDLAKALKS